MSSLRVSEWIGLVLWQSSRVGPTSLWHMCTLKTGIRWIRVKENSHWILQVHIKQLNCQFMWSIQGSKLLGFRISETPKNDGGNPFFGAGFPKDILSFWQWSILECNIPMESPFCLLLNETKNIRVNIFSYLGKVGNPVRAGETQFVPMVFRRKPKFLGLFLALQFIWLRPERHDTSIIENLNLCLLTRSWESFNPDTFIQKVCQMMLSSLTQCIDKQVQRTFTICLQVPQ